MLADELFARGAEVILVSGPVSIATTIPSENIINVTTADEMLAACKAHFDTLDIAIFCAAVADLKPASNSHSRVFVWNCGKPQMKKALQIIDLQRLNVIPLGLEPKTHTLKVYCSTN